MKVGILQMNLRSVEGVGWGKFNWGCDGGAHTRTFPVRGVNGYGLDANEDFIITGHSDGHLLNQGGAVLNSDRHQSLSEGWSAGGGPTGWVTTAFIRGGTCWGGIGWGEGEGGSGREASGRGEGCGMATLYFYKEKKRMRERS